MRSKSYHNSITALVITVVLVLLSGCKKGEKDEEVLFTSAEPVTDIEGNSYKTIKISN